MGTNGFHALLIGADFYLPNRLPDGSYYPSLHGCVRDIDDVEAFLRQRIEIAPDTFCRLAAEDDGSGNPTGPRESWPTYANMVAALKALVDRAQAGDQVYIHYSGHGGRVPTSFPDLKGADGLDETLVPIDIGDAGNRHVLDLELAYLLSALVEKDAFVTIVLDSCHSGGATRNNVGVRGIGVVDTTARPSESAIADAGAITNLWAGATRSAGRTFSLGQGVLPSPDGYVLLAACRPMESAHELPIGDRNGGALTYWTLQEMAQLAPTSTYRDLYRRVVPRVHAKFADQTPMLEGDADRLVLGAERVVYVSKVFVSEVDGERVTLGAGAAQSITVGARFAIDPSDATDLTTANERIGVIDIETVSGVTCVGVVSETRGDRMIQSDDIASLIDVGASSLAQTVRIANEGDAETKPRVAELLSAIESLGHGFVRTAAADEAAGWQINLTDAGYELLDAGGSLVPNVASQLDGATAEGVVAVLVHLARFKAIASLANVDALSALQGSITVSVARASKGRGAQGHDDDSGMAPWVLTEGESITVTVKNTGTTPLNFAVMDLQPDWGVSQVYPRKEVDNFLTLDAGQAESFPLVAGVPDGLTGVAQRDQLKVIATTEPTDFLWLSMPPLGEQRRSSQSRAANNAIEMLFEAITADSVSMRNLSAPVSVADDWTTTSIEIDIQRERES